MTDRHDVQATYRTAQRAADMLKVMLTDRKAAPAVAGAAAVCAELRLQTTLLAHIHGYDLDGR